MSCDSSSFFNIVLVQPEIPSNTGNIGRTCVGLYSHLHLVGPLGFEINDKRLKRAGLDYWPLLDYTVYLSWMDIETLLDNKRVFYFSTKGVQNLYQAQFRKGDWLVFGSETKGLNTQLLQKFSDKVLKIPVPGPIRSLNLANAVSAVAFEAFRQVSFKDAALDIST